MNMFEKVGAFGGFAGGVLILCGLIPLGQYFVTYRDNSWSERDTIIGIYRALSITGTVVLIVGAALFLYGAIRYEAEKRVKEGKSQSSK
jgi:hypothetical protein